MKYLFVSLLALLAVACNSSKQLHTTEVRQDSTVKAGKDSVAVSSSRTDESEDYERLTSMVYDLKESVDASTGKTVVQPWLKEVHYVEKGSKQSSEEKKDSTRVIDTTAIALSRIQAQLDKKSETQVLPGWLFGALGGLALLLLFLFLLLIYLHRRQSTALNNVLERLVNRSLNAA